ncbi:hypothetical protein CGRA01v4_12971 [Colletotrichum graminicola]|nr:hypothetical protein CGRA01v4_12971 [Colletotrichum graminicola]
MENQGCGPALIRAWRFHSPSRSRQLIKADIHTYIPTVHTRASRQTRHG